MTWDEKFMGVARLIATWSKDPNGGVGCIIIDKDNNQLSGGYNGFARGVIDDERLLDKPTKLKMIVHAEANAVAAAARNGHSLKGSTAYITLPPCSQCASLLIQSGVKKIIFSRDNRTDGTTSSWEGDRALAELLMREAHIEFIRTVL